MSAKTKKIITVIAIIICVSIVGSVGYACTYVGDIVITYPWDEYNLFEKVASYITGNGKGYTKQELYDKGLISGEETTFRKFNKSYYE